MTDTLIEECNATISEERTYKNRERLYEKYKDKLKVNKSLNRSLISFQANKSEPLYRWFKYKEGFSSAFISYILNLFGKPHEGKVVLDPFSGIGTTITTSIQNGFNAIGIELLQPGILATKARVISQKVDIKLLEDAIEKLRELNFSSSKISKKYFFRHISITKGAFPEETELGIANVNRFLAEEELNEDVILLFNFAVSSILEDVSFTRKDGQYLRWDRRSGKNAKSDFDKGKIYHFSAKLIDKLEAIKEDIKKTTCDTDVKNWYELISGSCLDQLHNIGTESIDLVITSPPYCNRYDYTRTYALELAYSGVDGEQIKRLRQTLLSATVENKSKFKYLHDLYNHLGKKEIFEKIVVSYSEQLALQESLSSLVNHREELNNKNIPLMVNNYFFEMNFVIHELSRTLKPGGKIIMVNDNVRYNGDEIPVDLILSEFARDAGLQTDVIWLLERGKGNSSQQMGAHGREELRKCVYVWSK